MSTNKKRAAPFLDIARKAIKPVKGAVLIAVCGNRVVVNARSAIQDLLLCNRTLASLPFPQIAGVTALYGAGSRDGFIAEAYAHAYARGHKTDKNVDVEQLADCNRIDALFDAGVHVTLDHLVENGCVTVEATLDGSAPENIVDALSRLDSGAKQKNALVLVFAHCGTADITWLSKYGGEVIRIDECERGPGVSTAFSVTAMSLESLHDCGIGRTMCEITAANDCLTCRTSVFIAASVHDRAMWYLWREGWSFGAIAEVSGYDKSTVMRRLKSLRLPRDVDADLDPPEGWHKEWFPFVGFETDGDDEAAPAPTRRGPIRI